MDLQKKEARQKEKQNANRFDDGWDSLNYQDNFFRKIAKGVVDSSQNY